MSFCHFQISGWCFCILIILTQILPRTIGKHALSAICLVERKEEGSNSSMEHVPGVETFVPDMIMEIDQSVMQHLQNFHLTYQHSAA